MPSSSRVGRTQKNDLQIFEDEGTAVLQKSGYVKLPATQRNIPEDQIPHVDSLNAK